MNSTALRAETKEDGTNHGKNRSKKIIPGGNRYAVTPESKDGLRNEEQILQDLTSGKKRNQSTEKLRIYYKNTLIHPVLSVRSYNEPMTRRNHLGTY